MLGYQSISIHRLYESITQELISAHAGRPAATRSSRFPHFTVRRLSHRRRLWPRCRRGGNESWEDTLCCLICSSWQLLEIKRSNLRSGIPGIQDKHGGAPGYSLHPSDPRRPESVVNEVFHHFLVSFNYLISEQKSKFWSFWLFTFML